ncbi:stage V sporulation protein S [Bacillus cereus]|uniref:lasso peptide biosynthesis B2 protein n=1 Tax=Bacillus cereus TaxID=1396 RepID=UPI000BF4D103|nr:lasso peptide biosynthesis B2 protein [Bacillus cereus]PFA18432.1 stage V sporulation protein S [Bacillus cereus]
MKKVKKFLALNTQMKLLFAETFFLLGWARILKIIPFSKVASSLGKKEVETNFISNEKNRETLKGISRAIHVMSEHTLWESQCLVKAIAAMKMLEKRGIESTLYLGMAKDEDGKLIAHAWLRSGSYYVTGSEGMERFTVVGKFAKHINTKKN